MKTKVFYLLVLSVLLSGSFGCSGLMLRHVNVDRGAKKYAEKVDVEKEFVEVKKNEVRVNIVMDGEFGCYTKVVQDPNESQEKGRYKCVAFLVDKQIPRTEVMAKRNEDGVKTDRGLYFYKFSDNLQARLESELQNYYENVTVTISEKIIPDAINITPSLTFYEATMRTGFKRAFIELDINYVMSQLENKATAQISHQIGNGHLAWLIPLGVLTFPLGFLIGSMIFDNIEQGKMEETVTEAIFEASQKAAKLIATQDTR